MKSLKDLFEETLKDVYFAEKTILKSLPKMAKKTTLPSLQQFFEDHAEQTKTQVERLDKIFKLLGKKAAATESHALTGLVKEAEELMSGAKDADVRDAGLIGCAQAIENYEMARYGTLRAWAEQLGMAEAVKLLDETLKKEQAAVEKLRSIAKGKVNEEVKKPVSAPKAKTDTKEKPKAQKPVAAPVPQKPTAAPAVQKTVAKSKPAIASASTSVAAKAKAPVAASAKTASVAVKTSVRKK